MACPNLTEAEVTAAIPGLLKVKYIGDGGQKRVFRATINGIVCAIKFMSPSVQSAVPGDFASADVSTTDEVTARARREVDTMRQCNTPYLVKPGPAGLMSVTINGGEILYFSEEFIEGENLADYLKRQGKLSVPDIVRLASQMTTAIGTLWALGKIHRDIKPSNIMRRNGSGDFVLLDMGLVFDLGGASYSMGPMGTAIYFSPEQTDFQNRRSVLDFRSDVFSLGIVLYQMVTGRHPFLHNANTSWDVLRNIQAMTPELPRKLRPEMPTELNDLILRMLGKRPSLRYRTIEALLTAIRSIPV